MKRCTPAPEPAGHDERLCKGCIETCTPRALSLEPAGEEELISRVMARIDSVADIT